jgi:hypothetical protein
MSGPTAKCGNVGLRAPLKMLADVTLTQSKDSPLTLSWRGTIARLKVTSQLLCW